MKKSLQGAWILKTEKGRQRWFFDTEKAQELAGSVDPNTLLQLLDESFVYDAKQNPNAADSIHRHKAIKLAEGSSKPETLHEVTSRGLEYFGSLQEEDGNWAGDYGGPHFLLPGLVFVMYITDSMPSPEKQVLMKRYLLNHQNEDGGWGLHIESESTMFGTVLNYVALILLGHALDDPRSEKAVSWIRQNGSATEVPPWGKMYLALLGLYDWNGLDALLPELWILPKKTPIYPGRYWNHARMVYLPMSYFSGMQFQLTENELIASLKQQLYTQPFDQVNWKKARRACCVKDDYNSEPALYRFLAPFMNFYNKIHLKSLRKKALLNIVERVHAEDGHTNYINLGPVNKVLNMLIVFIEEGKSERFNKHLARLDDYLWVAEDGMKMNGYNGSQFWDTVFMAHAILEGKDLSANSKSQLAKIEQFLQTSFIRENEWKMEQFDRSVSVGGWPFSTVEHGWPITDCTAEGLKAVLSLHKRGLLTDKQLLAQAPLSVDFLLSYQNKNGGWASYEKTRGGKWLEKLNPARVFGEIMIDYSYVECTSACLQSLHAYHIYDPNYRTAEIQDAIKKGINFILSKQMENNLWFGSWAVCFTYGSWFALEALATCGGYSYDAADLSNPLTRACNALVEKQRADGSWGESYVSSLKKTYIQHEEGQVINTAWALLSLMVSKYPNQQVIERGIQFLALKQDMDGDWPQQGISGTFNHNCMITYINYRNIFPLWALQRYLSLKD